MSTIFWVLYDPNKKTQTEKLSQEEAQFTLMKMRTREVNDFLIWRSDWQKWKRLKEFIDSEDSPFMKTFMNIDKEKKNSQTQPSALKMKPVDAETENVIRASFSGVQLEEVKLSNVVSTGEAFFDSDQLSDKKQEVTAGLNFKGLNKTNALSKNTGGADDKNKLELLLISPREIMFRTFAKDISLSGTFCERIIPDDFHHADFDLVIINKFITDNQFNRLTLKAKLIITGNSLYIEYLPMTPTQKESLRAILEYYLRAQKKISS